MGTQHWAPNVNVVVRNGVIELLGVITDERERQGLIVLVENVAGVKEVHDPISFGSNRCPACASPHRRMNEPNGPRRLIVVKKVLGMRIRHRERHRAERIGWLRAAVLGANDGIVSTASLLLGVAAAHGTRSNVIDRRSRRSGCGRYGDGCR